MHSAPARKSPRASSADQPVVEDRETADRIVATAYQLRDDRRSSIKIMVAEHDARTGSAGGDPPTTAERPTTASIMDDDPPTTAAVLEHRYEDRDGIITEYNMQDQLRGYPRNTIGWWGAHDETGDDMIPFVAQEQDYRDAVFPSAVQYARSFGLRRVVRDDQLPAVGNQMYIWFSAQPPFAAGFYRARRTI